MGRTGYINGTLAVREGLRAPVPAVDPRPIMTMADMGHGGMGGGHDMSSMSGASMAGMDHGATTAKPAAQDMSGMDHSGHDMSAMRSEEHTSELQSLMSISYAVFCLKKKTNKLQTCNNKNQ